MKTRGTRFTGSYEEKKSAMEEAVHLLQTGVPQNSLCAALLRKSASLDPFRFKFNRFRRQVTIPFQMRWLTL